MPAAGPGGAGCQPAAKADRQDGNAPVQLAALARPWWTHRLPVDEDVLAKSTGEVNGRLQGSRNIAPSVQLASPAPGQLASLGQRVSLARPRSVQLTSLARPWWSVQLTSPVLGQQVSLARPRSVPLASPAPGQLASLWKLAQAAPLPRQRGKRQNCKTGKHKGKDHTHRLREGPVWVRVGRSGLGYLSLEVSVQHFNDLSDKSTPWCMCCFSQAWASDASGLCAALSVLFADGCIHEIKEEGPVWVPVV